VEPDPQLAGKLQYCKRVGMTALCIVDGGVAKLAQDVEVVGGLLGTIRSYDKRRSVSSNVSRSPMYSAW
jgi:hypothetical protein